MKYLSSTRKAGVVHSDLQYLEWTWFSACPLQVSLGNKGTRLFAKSFGVWCYIQEKAPQAQRWVHFVWSRRDQNKGLLVVPDACVKTTRTVKVLPYTHQTPIESDIEREVSPPKHVKFLAEWIVRIHKDTYTTTYHFQSLRVDGFHIWLVAKCQKCRNLGWVHLTWQNNGWTWLRDCPGCSPNSRPLVCTVGQVKPTIERSFGRRDVE